MAVKIPYYPGCTLKATAKNFEDTARLVAGVFDYELDDLYRWNCCGAVYGLSEDNVMHKVAPVRNLLRVKEVGEKRVLTLCSMCFNTLKRANYYVRKNKDKLEVINAIMYLENTTYDGSVEVIHLLELLRDEIGFDKVKKAVKKPLEGITVAAYYGCLLLRPGEIAIDNMEQPTVMEDLMEALGAKVVDLNVKTECCGAYQTVARKDLVADRTNFIVEEAHASGADVLITSCPLCHFNLDRRQKDAKERHPEFKPMPILYFTQLMALALGFEEDKLGFDSHYIDPRPLLKERGLL